MDDVEDPRQGSAREDEATALAPTPDMEALARRSEEALARLDAEVELPSTGLLSFYDRLRERVVGAAEVKGGRLGEGAVRALLLVPDVFMLLVRLALDKSVPASARMLIGGALAYFVLPIDLIPEGIVGVGGYVDDLVLAAAVLSQAFSGELEPYARRHWSGAEDLRVVLRDVAYTAENLMGAKVYGRLKALLARRGVRLDPTT